MIHSHGECQNLNDTYIQDWVTQMANTRKYGEKRQILFATKDQKQKIYLIINVLYPCVMFFGME